MSTDPRCPHCGEKVSATARWCMHCSRDFDEPTDATGGFEAVADGDLGEVLDLVDRTDAARTGLAVGVGFATWILLLLTANVTGVATFPMAAGFTYYLSQKRRAADVLIGGAHGAAVLVVSVHLLGVALDITTPGTTPLAVVLDPGTAIVAGALVFAGHRLKNSTGP